MSGGHFNDNGYIYYKLHQFADELEHEIENNITTDEFGYAPKLNENILNYMRQKVVEIHKMAEEMRCIDYLYSSDYGEDSFMKRIEELK